MRAKRVRVQNSGQARLFENPFLEFFTKGHPLVIWGMYIPVISYFIYLSHARFGFDSLTVVLLFLGGMFFWTFFEYMAHRYLFHWVSDHAGINRIAYVMHGNHHHYPKDKQRLFMPPLPSIILASLIFGGQYLFLRDFTWAFFPGFMLGYLLYASMHYAIHAYEPPFKWMQPLWRNHHLHHYRNEHLGFGVSNTLWDRLFGTMFDLRKVKVDPNEVAKLKFDNK